MNSGSNGSSNRLAYDECAYKKQLQESTSPFNYRMYEGAFENCNKCVQDKFYKPYDLVDQESELKNITRKATLCPKFKYDPNCKKSKTCTSTFDKSVPVVLAPEVCPIVSNNIKKSKKTGFKKPDMDYCDEKIDSEVKDMDMDQMVTAELE